MNTGKKIKDLRKKVNLSQERFAEMLCVNNKVVSRWENDNTYPDITLLAKIATIFNVSTDFLLDVNQEKVKKEIDDFCDYVSDKYHKGEINEDLLKEIITYSNKYPNNYPLKVFLFQTYCTIDEDKYYDDAVKVGEDILKNSNEMIIKEGVIVSLFYMYYHHGDLQKAEAVINDLPTSPKSTKWKLEPRLLKGEERIKAVENQIIDICEEFCDFIMQTYGRREVGQRNQELLKIKALYDLVFEDGDYYYYSGSLLHMYLWCAQDQAKIKNSEKVIFYLNEALKCSLDVLQIYKEGKPIKHTSFLVDRIEEYPSNWSYSGKTVYTNYMLKFLEREEFAYLEDNEEIMKIKQTCFDNPF